MVGKILVLVNIFILTTASPISFLNFDDLEDDNYDIIVDQKQNGSQNFRIRVNGLNVALPADEEDPQNNQQIQSESDLASLLFSGLSAPTSQSSSSHVSNDKNELAALAALFDWKKKSNKKSSDTQSRTKAKDIPTQNQLSGDAQEAVRDYIKGTGRKYKLFIGEKYIIPLLQFLKQQHQQDDSDE